MDKAPRGHNLRQKHHIDKRDEVLETIDTRQIEILIHLAERFRLTQHGIHELTGIPAPILSAVYKQQQITPAKLIRGGKDNINSIRIARAKAEARKEFGPELDEMRKQFGVSYGPKGA